jgi:ABC-type glycerol-3-phosphate transport system substrate-binding protein
VETGIFYNKTLFDRYHVKIPQDWREFIQLQKMFADSGLIPLATDRNGFMDWAPDLLFDQCYFEILNLLDYKKKSDLEEAYYQGYLTPEELCWLTKKGWFSARNPRFRESWRLLKEWRQFWQKDLTHSDQARLFITQRSPMFWTGSWFVRRLKLDPLINFDWGVFYPPAIPRNYSAYCCGVNQCVIGGAGIQFHITRRAIDDNDLEQTVDFLRFITTPEHASQIANEAGMFIANIVGAFLPQNLAPFEEIVLRRYCTVKWQYSLGHRFTDNRERLIEFFLNGGMSLDDFMIELDRSLQQTADRLIQENGWQEPKNVPNWSPGIDQEYLTSKICKKSEVELSR